MYRIAHPTPVEYTFFLTAHQIFSRTDHMEGHKTSLKKLTKSEITPSIISDHSGMKEQSVTQGKLEKFTTVWKLNNTLLNNQWVKEEIKGD